MVPGSVVTLPSLDSLEIYSAVQQKNKKKPTKKTPHTKCRTYLGGWWGMGVTGGISIFRASQVLSNSL